MNKRIHYYLTIDTETANTLDCPFMYDIGGAIHDNKGIVYETFSFIIYDVFFADRELFNTAYYAAKRPIYEKDITEGRRKVVNIYTAKQYIQNLATKYNIKAVIAHNARFDYLSTTNTIRYLTKSKTRYFLPHGVPVWDTMKMAQDTICKQKKYIKFCQENGYCLKNGKVRSTAEILYRYIIGDNDFIESHTGLEDVLIEKEIFVRCVRQHKKMRRSAWE